MYMRNINLKTTSVQAFASAFLMTRSRCRAAFEGNAYSSNNKRLAISRKK